MTKAEVRRFAKGYIADLARREADDLGDMVYETVPEDMHSVCREEFRRIAERLAARN